ncbi:mechanosensitive ion channel family protein [Thermodesulfobacteriota bacterium]
MDLFQRIPRQLIISFLILVSGVLIYVIFRYVLRKILLQVSSLTKEEKIPYGQAYAPLHFLFPPLFLLLTFPLLELSHSVRKSLDHILSIWAIVGISWLLIRIFNIIKFLILSRYEIAAKDNLEARRISTQLEVIKRVLDFLIILIATSSILMTFEKVRQIGVSLLASAGIAGIIIGFAAQRSLATLIAGIQIAITQPIRIDDVVIVENEWGWIEEITLTYVVVRIWDQRRLVVPITYFIEQPFQNWTRTTAELLGTVFIYADYRAPIDELRKELQKIVEDSPLWDKRVAKMQVTNATDKTIELRALVSAENSSNAFELRTIVREKLINFLQKNYPESLPIIRVELDKD